MFFCTYAFLAGLYGNYGIDFLTPSFVFYISRHRHHHQVFIFTAVVTSLLRERLDTDAAFAATALVERIRTFNRR
jgi:hypothetical protein